MNFFSPSAGAKNGFVVSPSLIAPMGRQMMAFHRSVAEDIQREYQL